MSQASSFRSRRSREAGLPVHCPAGGRDRQALLPCPASSLDESPGEPAGDEGPVFWEHPGPRGSLPGPAAGGSGPLRPPAQSRAMGLFPGPPRY